MNTSEQDKLSEFLKSNRPTAPEAPPNELNLIRAKIADSTRQRRPLMSWWRLAIPIAVAASLTLFVITDFSEREELRIMPADNVELEEFMEDTYAVLDNGNDELAVGSDWLLLVP